VTPTIVISLKPVRDTLLVLLVCSQILLGCGNSLSLPEQVQDKDLSSETYERFKAGPGISAVDVNTLWQFEVQYFDENNGLISTTRAEVLYVLGEWRTDLAPIQPSKDYTWFRYPGLFASGAPDMAEAIRVAPRPLTLKPWQDITPVNETTSMKRPRGTATMQARVLQVCPVTVRRMRQFHWRPRGESVVDLRQVKEEMRWREYRVSAACRIF
jgi:hypothetical protein